MGKIINKYSFWGTVIGLIVGAALMFLMQKFNGKMTIYTGYPIIAFEFDYSGKPHQVPISFGISPSRIELGEAFRRIAILTQDKGPARIYIDEKIYNNKIATTIADPPSGPTPSIMCLQQILASTNTSGNLLICIMPEGGYKVSLK